MLERNGGQGVPGNSLYSLSNFAVNRKLFFKKVCLKERERGLALEVCTEGQRAAASRRVLQAETAGLVPVLSVKCEIKRGQRAFGPSTGRMRLALPREGKTENVELWEEKGQRSFLKDLPQPKDTDSPRCRDWQCGAGAERGQLWLLPSCLAMVLSTSNHSHRQDGNDFETRLGNKFWGCVHEKAFLHLARELGFHRGHKGVKPRAGA